VTLDAACSSPVNKPQSLGPYHGVGVRRLQSYSFRFGELFVEGFKDFVRVGISQVEHGCISNRITMDFLILLGIEGYASCKLLENVVVDIIVLTMNHQVFIDGHVAPDVELIV